MAVPPNRFVPLPHVPILGRRMGKEAPNVMVPPEPDTYKPSWEFDGVGWMMRVPLIDKARGRVKWQGSGLGSGATAGI